MEKVKAVFPTRFKKNEKDKKECKRSKLFFQPDSKAGSHGLLTYASTSCYGGKKTLTTPCPKVSKHENDEDFEEEKRRCLQGSCLNYKLKRYSCFIADIEPGGDLVDGYGPKESRKVIF